MRLKAPLPRPNSIRDFMVVEEHVRRSGMPVPEEWFEIPVYHKGNADAVFGPGDEIRWPAYTEKLDYELELAIVIGRRGRGVSVDEAPDYIAGFMLFNDWSARDLQVREMKVGLGPALGKDFANSFGPCLVTADEIADLQGSRCRRGSTARCGRRARWARCASASPRSSRTSPRSSRWSRATCSAAEPSVVAAGSSWTAGSGPGDTVELEADTIGVLANRVVRDAHPSE